MEPGLEGDDRPGFSIPMYVFKRNRNDSSFARRTQALAAGGLFEIEVADAGAVKLVLTPIDQPDQVTCTLELSDDRSEGTVDLGLVQLVHNWEALGHAVRVALGNHREGRDSHFRPYYWLSDSAGACNQSGKPAALPVPFRTHWFRRVPERRLKEVCPSSILFSAEEFRKHYTIANVLTWFASPKPDSESPMPESATAFFSKEWEWEDIKVGMTVSPIKSPAGYSLMNVVGPPLCTPMRMEKGEE
jgi:hypothetical protein